MTGFATDASAVAHSFAPDLDDEVTLEGDAAHHLGRVRRLRAGERVTIADGAGSWRLYEVARSGRAQLALHAIGTTELEPMPAIRVVLAFAPAKGGQPERVVQAATELGVDEIRILVTERTVVRYRDGRESSARARLERIAREAAGQCFRSRFLALGPTVSPADLATVPGLIVAHRDGERSPPVPPGPEWTIAVGPEGGLTDEELAELDRASRLRLGELVLRAETAASAAATIVTAMRAEVSRGAG